jgi:UDP-N-acetylglucosamine 2-epimerase (non-hydrolysing)
MKKNIHLIAAARPNFMKIAPLFHALKKEEWAVPEIVHTGQHYDINMSDAFFKDLMLPEPHYHLGIGSGSHAEQTGNVMIAYEKLLHETQPDMVVVVGDVNSTVACTLAAIKINYRNSKDGNGSGSKLQRPLVAHLEAGLRSFDRTMPEEINRIVTDSLADLLWTPSPDGDESLKNEGVSSEKVERVGNIMIDSLEMLRPKIEQEQAAEKYGFKKGEYALVTLHRPANVDDPDTLKAISNRLLEISESIPLIFPVHPRTKKNLEQERLWTQLVEAKNIHLEDPAPYIRFMSLVFNSNLLITDSGGVQEETTYLGVPCLTLRPNTERPITVEQGTNLLCNIDSLTNEVAKCLEKENSQHSPIDLWDGATSSRIVKNIRINIFR